MISIVLPAHNEEEHIIPLHKALCEVARSMPEHEFEFVFVDDFSMDATPKLLRDLAVSDTRIAIIRFARNCGSHAAIAAGLQFCTGDVAIMLAADLQDPPEIIPCLF